MKNEIFYANWWSRALFKESFEKQFYIPLPPRKMDRNILGLIEWTKFSGDFLEVEVDRPIFIVGLPRSGTTLLYNLLCAHEGAAFITNSINAFVDAPCAIEWLRKKLDLNIRGERFLADSIDTDFGSPSEPIIYWNKWFKREVDDLYWQPRLKSDYSESEQAAIYRDIRKIISSAGKGPRRFVLKYPLMQTELKMVQEFFPDARFVHITRDGRDVAQSLVKLYRMSNEQIAKINHPLIKHIVPYPRVKNLKNYVEEFGADSVECTARVWRDTMDITAETRPALSNFFELRYEDLVREPDRVLGEIFDFCQWEYPSPYNSLFKRTRETIGHLRHRNNYDRVESVEAAIGPDLKRYGY